MRYLSASLISQLSILLTLAAPGLALAQQSAQERADAEISRFIGLEKGCAPLSTSQVFPRTDDEIAATIERDAKRIDPMIGKYPACARALPGAIRRLQVFDQASKLGRATVEVEGETLSYTGQVCVSVPLAALWELLREDAACASQSQACGGANREMERAMTELGAGGKLSAKDWSYNSKVLLDDVVAKGISLKCAREAFAALLPRFVNDQETPRDVSVPSNNAPLAKPSVCQRADTACGPALAKTGDLTKYQACLVAKGCAVAKTLDYSVGFDGEDGERFPYEANLREQFSNRRDIQQGGTCHIYSAVALAEAACYRHIGKHVDISEAYFFYRHLRAGMQSRLDRGEWMNFLSKDAGDITSEDGGLAIDTLNRLTNGSVLTEREMPFDQQFLQTISEQSPKFLERAREAWQKHRQELIEYGITQRQLDLAEKQFIERAGLQYQEEFCDLLDRTARAKCRGSKPVRAESGGIAFETLDADLRACVATLGKARAETFTPERAIRYLSRGIPFICREVFTFPDGSQGGHAAVVVGYKYDPSSKNKLRFETRDSNGAKFDTGWEMSCENGIVVLE